MTKVEELIRVPNVPEEQPVNPAGLESVLQHQSFSAAAPRPPVDMDTTGLKPGHGEGVLGLQLCSPVWRQPGMSQLWRRGPLTWTSASSFSFCASAYNMIIILIEGKPNTV